MRRFKIILLITVIASIIAGNGIQRFLPEKKIDERIYLHEIAPDLKFSEKKTNPPHYISDEGIAAFNSYDIVPTIRGYAGPIKILLGLSPDGKIIGIKILGHKETENYVHYMETPSYLQRFLGKSIHDPFEIDKDIDGISRATVSVGAMAKTIRESSRIIASSVYGIDITEGGGLHWAAGINWLWYLLVFSSAFPFYFVTRKSKQFFRIRDVSLIASILVIGLYISSPFSILHIFNLLLLRPSSSLLWYVLIISTGLSILIAGRFYCGWLCPFGALSEFIGRLPSTKWNIPVEIDDRWREAKYFLLGVVAIVVFLTGRVDFGNYETYVTLFSFHGNFLTWSLVGITLLANLKIERFWCRYLCPVAALTGMLSRKVSGYPSRHDCPIGNKPAPLIAECIRCNRCYTTVKLPATSRGTS
ncbi:MAG: 4Fe-4S binding protein [Thermodesulfovibrionales bacterium]|jgi:Na+-translocating ferredoxin:NAD+ oxidoreductase RnfG subunit